MAALPFSSRHRWLVRGSIALAALSCAVLLRAQTVPDAPVVDAPTIIDALSSKDVVIDRPGTAPGRRRPRTDPAIDLQVQFEFDSADLLPQGRRQLDQLAMALNDRMLSGAAFVLAGHTDRVGEPDYNLQLSQARASSVKSYLTRYHAVAADRLQTVGYGYSRLIDPQHPTAAANRRVEVRRVSSGRVGFDAGSSDSESNAPPSTLPPPPPSTGRLVPTPR